MKETGGMAARGKSINRRRGAFSLKKENTVKLFEQKEIRTHWDNEAEKWYFSITDACAVLADSKDGRNYWKVLKNRLKKEGSQLVTDCRHPPKTS